MKSSKFSGKGITLEKAVEVLSEYSNVDGYIQAGLSQFLNRSGEADDNSCELYDYWHKCLKVLVASFAEPAAPSEDNPDVQELAEAWADKKFKKDNHEVHNVPESVLWLNRYDNFEAGYNAAQKDKNKNV